MSSKAEHRPRQVKVRVWFPVRVPVILSVDCYPDGDQQVAGVEIGEFHPDPVEIWNLAEQCHIEEFDDRVLQALKEDYRQRAGGSPAE